MNSISPNELKQWLDSGKKVQIIDVREPWERKIGLIDGSDHIIMNLIPENIEKINRDSDVVVLCRSGARSAAVAQYLVSQQGFSNIYNLEGGITAWAERVDPNVEVA